MKKLSIVIKEESENRIKEYVNILSLLLSCDSELIIINNNLDENKLKLEFPFRFYKYRESYKDFKNFCLDICLSDNILLIESGFLLDENIINEISKALSNNNQLNIAVEFKTYISKEKSLYFINKKYILFNAKSKRKCELNYIVDNIEFVEYDNNYLEDYIYKFILEEKYLELYQWYTNIVLHKCDEDLWKFYRILEKIKLNLDKKIIEKIENIFINHESDSKYRGYLKLKNLYNEKKENFNEELINYLRSVSLNNEDIYFSYLILRLFTDGKFYIEIYKALNPQFRKLFIEFLFENNQEFYAYLFNYIVSLNIEEEISAEENEDNIILYKEIINYYLKCMSNDSADPIKKKMLVQALIEYVNYSMYILTNRRMDKKEVFSEEELKFLTELDKAVTLINSNNIKESIEKLKKIDMIYDPTTIAVRYYLQQLIIDNNLYSNKLSICMIVKNEEKNLVRCLESLKPIFDNNIAELIIVDTGSEDKTVEIAKLYTNNIYFHPWQGSFSEARNYSISLATGEYILIMDADLEIEKKELYKFIDYFNRDEYKNYNTISSEFKNFDNEKLTKYSKMTQYHIFKNDGTFYYSGKVHNQPQFKQPCKNLDVTMLHYGYIMTEDVKDKKFYRTAELLKKELERNPRSLYYRMQLITSYSMHGDNIKALQEVEVLMKQIKDEKIEIGTYLMPYNVAAIVYAANNLYDVVIEISDIVLSKQPDFIDLIYLKANAFYNKNMYKKAAQYYEDYLKLLLEIGKHDIIKDDKIIFYTLDQKLEALKTVLICYYEIKEYEKLEKAVDNNQDIELLNSCLYLIIKAYLESGNLNKLGKLFKYVINENNSDELLRMFIFYLVEELMRLNNKEEVLKCFYNLNIDERYISEINNMLESKMNLSNFLELIENYDLESADIITAKMLIDKAVPIIINFNFQENHNLKEVVIIKDYSKYIINGVLNTKIFMGFDKQAILSIIQKYLELCISLFNSEKDALNEEETQFIENFISALNYIDEDRISLAVQKIRDGVIVNKKMANAMDLYLEVILPNHKSKFQIEEEKNKVNEDLNNYCSKIKNQIEHCINNQELNQALYLIEEYEQIIHDDAEICSMKAIIEILNSNFNKAEEYLLDGIRLDKYNFDNNYNLAYVYEILGEHSKALEYYRISRQLNTNYELSDTINKKILEITTNHKEALVSKKKLVFFVKTNLDSFLGDIIDNLEKDYDIKKVIVTHYNQIDEGMEWADICWFEWCDELIIYGSKHRLAKDKIIICRLHRYEVFTDYPKNVYWENVNKLILVTHHLKELLNNIVPNIENKVEITIIENGVNLQKYKFKVRKKGYNIAYIGYIHSRKNPSLLLQIIKALVNINSEYKLFIAGAFQEPLFEMYFSHQVKELGIEKNVVFSGWQNDIDSWLEDKDYIISTSIHESFGYSIAEAMTKGIRPIIHNFIFAKEIWNEKYLFNSVEEAIRMIISDDYSSRDYNNFIVNNYSLKKQINLIKTMLNSIDVSIKKFDYEAYWDNRLNYKFDIEGVGYLGLGKIYNKFLYKIRFEILEKLLKDLFENSLTDVEVLELGPGIGMFTEYFYSKDIKKYKGIDITSKSVSELSKKFNSYTFIQGDVSEPKLFEKSKYDLIFAADVLLHITDENKYIEAIKNISYSLKENGFAILFDPISMIGTKSESEHVIIRDINYVSHILQENELELVSTIPSSFFMNYPFDNGILKEKSEIAIDTFNNIQNIFSNNSISNSAKEELGSWISTLEKICLIKNNFGLSQKVLIIKRKGYDRQDIRPIQISNIFRIEEVCNEEVYWSEIVSKNEELVKWDITKILRELIFKIK